MASALRVRYVGASGTSGYARAVKLMVAALVEVGVAVEFSPSACVGGLPEELDAHDALLQRLRSSRPRPYDVLVLHTVPDQWTRLLRRELRRGGHTGARPRVYGMTLWETDAVPPEWHGPLSTLVDRVSVASEWNRAAFVRAVPPHIPVDVVRYAVPLPPSPSPPAPDAPLPLPPGEAAVSPSTYVFYTVNVWNGRKGICELVDVYLDTFTADDDVLLYVKSGGPGSLALADAQAFVAAQRRRRARPARIVLQFRRMSTADVLRIHRRGDCFVTLTRGEGLGYGLVEAALCGKPVVATGYGAQTEYLKDCWYLPYRKVPAAYCLTDAVSSAHARCRVRFPFSPGRCVMNPLYNPTSQQWGAADRAAARQTLGDLYQRREHAGHPDAVEHLHRTCNLHAVGTVFEASLRATFCGQKNTHL